MAFQPIAKKEYYSIGEVCEITGLKPHVLRYWETQFKGIQPVKNRAGNRAYRRREIELVQLIKKLLYQQKFTIEGARQRLEEMRRGRSDQLEAELEESRVKGTFETLADDLSGLVGYIEAFRRGEVEPGAAPARDQT
jgi:DNA-binding transcriptional MerR regulator